MFKRNTLISWLELGERTDGCKHGKDFTKGAGTVANSKISVNLYWSNRELRKITEITQESARSQARDRLKVLPYRQEAGWLFYRGALANKDGGVKVRMVAFQEGMAWTTETRDSKKR